MATILLQAVLFLFAVVVFFKISTSLSSSRGKKDELSEPPEASFRWPVIGHLLVLALSRNVPRTLGRIADKRGPIFTIWAGFRRGIVISSWDIAKECFTTHDRVLATRPDLAACNHIGYDRTMLVIAPYGPYWRHARKMITLQLLSARQLEQLKPVRVEEISMNIHRLYRSWASNPEQPLKLELKTFLCDLTFNIICMIVIGKRYYGEEKVEDEAEAGKFKEAMDRALFLTGNIIPSDALPFLEWLDLGGYIRIMKRTMKDLDVLASSWVEAHRSRRIDGEKDNQDFMGVILSALEETPLPDCETDVAIKATALNLILAGTDTTYVTMTWVFALLMNNPHVLKKAQEEVDEVVGKDRNVEESDVQNLPYLQAVVKETLRLYPSAPIGVPHESIQDVNISGYHVPAGTMIIFNLWKIHRDPTVWEEPNEFRPERFLTTQKDVDMKGQHFQLLPFGAGRRICPGIIFALQVTHLTIARLLHGFDVRTPGGKPVDMSEGTGLTMPKVTLFDVLLTPRLPSHLYGL